MEVPHSRKSMQNEFTLASITHLSPSSSPPNLSPVARFCSDSSELRFEQAHEPVNFNIQTSQVHFLSSNLLDSVFWICYLWLLVYCVKDWIFLFWCEFCWCVMIVFGMMRFVFVIFSALQVRAYRVIVHIRRFRNC